MATEALQPLHDGLQGCLISVLEGPDTGLEHDLADGKVIIGTSADAEIRLTDPTVSSQHVSVSVTEDGLVVSDLGSTNGTYYLETKIREVVVVQGAAITVGSTRIGLASPWPT